MSGITTIIITLNEERNIERCIASVAGVSDEIIVVDSYSTDRTVDIARKMGATVLQREWEGYAATKNWANRLATNDFILSMDADEALSPDLKDSITNAKTEGLSGVYSFNRLTNYCGQWIRHCGWYPDVKLRLFPKAIAEWKGDFVHEEITFMGSPNVQHLAGDIEHYSYYTSQEHLDRIKHYSTLGAQKMQATGKRGGKLRGGVSAAARFTKMYFLRLGFLDGRAGWDICRISAMANWLRYKKRQVM